MHSSVGSIDVQERGCPDVVAGFVDVAVSAIQGGDECKAVMEILCARQCFGFDDDLSCFVDIAPFAADLDGRESFREVKCQVKLRFDDDLPGVIDKAVLVAEFPPGKTFDKVPPHSCAVLFTRRHRWLQGISSRRVNVATVVPAVDWSKMLLE